MRNYSRKFPRLTDRRKIGALEVGPVCLGRASAEAVEAAFDAGVNFFFVSADLHWPLYEGSRRGIERLIRRGLRDRIVVAVASYATQPEFCWKPFQEVIECVGLGRIDVTIAGGAYGHELPARMPVYRAHKASGFSRAIGASLHDRRASLEDLDLAFVRYNALHWGARVDLFPTATTPLYNFTSTFGYVPPSRFAELGLTERHWRPRRTDHYRFALTRPEVSGLLCSLDAPSHVADLAAALEEGPLDEEEERYLMDLAELASQRPQTVAQ